MGIPSNKRVVMAREVARRFLEERSNPEYRLEVFYDGTAREKKALPNLFRAFRDGKVKVGHISSIPDLGISEEFDHFTLWSSNRDSLIELKNWLEKHGHETSGIW